MYHLGSMIGGLIIITIGYACALLFIPLQVAALVYTRGGIRIAALAILPLALFVGVITIIALLQQSNLWPICMIFLSPFGVAYLVACIMAEAVQRRVDPNHNDTLIERRHRRGLCGHCGYDLRGDIAGGCPECGWGRSP